MSTVETFRGWDSEAVRRLKAELQSPSLRDGSDWADHHRKLLQRRIRSQRLAEARACGTHTDAEWFAIVSRFDSRCVRCGCWPMPRPCKDHIVPIYQGGSDAATNLQPLCRQCNTSKGPDTFDWAAYRDEHGFDEVTA